jgi:precorrin-8X/cobalt-precorrin-8 methylmutase
MTQNGHRYLCSPDEIYARSFEIAARECDLSGIDSSLHQLALRLVHTVGDPSIVDDLAFSRDALSAGSKALVSGSTIFTDSSMVAAGITRRFLAAGNLVQCCLDKQGANAFSKSALTTRAMLAIERWAGHFSGQVVVIGNAPTALFRLIELIEGGLSAPAVIIAMPVGFVGAAEAKETLLALARGRNDISYLMIKGRRGGSALAAAAVNALAIEANP